MCGNEAWALDHVSIATVIVVLLIVVVSVIIAIVVSVVVTTASVSFDACATIRSTLLKEIGR